MLTFHSHFPYILCPLTVPQIPDDLKKRKTNLLATKTVIRLAPDKWYTHVINPTCPLDRIILINPTCPLDRIILQQIIIGLPVRATPNQKMEAALTVQQKNKMVDRSGFPSPLPCVVAYLLIFEGNYILFLCKPIMKLMKK